MDGPLGIGGEWGHTPLPWPTVEELAIQPCWCGRRGCLETWISGTGLANDHMRVTHRALSCEQIALAAQQGDTACRATLDRHAHRLARGLAMITNLIDPTVIVFGRRSFIDAPPLSNVARPHDALRLRRRAQHADHAAQMGPHQRRSRRGLALAVNSCLGRFSAAYPGNPTKLGDYFCGVSTSLRVVKFPTSSMGLPSGSFTIAT